MTGTQNWIVLATMAVGAGVTWLGLIGKHRGKFIVAGFGILAIATALMLLWR